MGASWSGIFGVPSNKSTRQILDTILRRLVTETDMRDMYGLADPEVCKKFVIFGAEAFSKLFMQVRLNKTKEGTLFFQQLKGLGEQNPDPALQKKNCLELANFFVSIFKIYAAVALSIFDSEFPPTEVSDYRITRRNSQRGVQFFNPQTGFKGFSREAPGYMWGQRGFMQPPALQGQRGGKLDPTGNGAYFYLDDTTAPYQCLNAYLVVPTEADASDINILVDKKLTQGHELYFPHSSLYEDAFSQDATDPTYLKRTPKAYGAGIPFRGTLVMAKGAVELSGILSMSQTVSNISVYLVKVNVGSKALADISFQVTQGAGSLSAGVSGYDSSNKKVELPGLIVQNIMDAYTLKYPETFIAEAFLRSHRVLYDDRFQDSMIYLEGADPTDPGVLRISYRPEEKLKVRPEEKAEKVVVKMTLKMKRVGKDSGSNKYHLKLSLKNVDATPPELNEIFDVYDTYEEDKGYKETYFLTDSADISVPRQQATNASMGQWIERTIKSLIEKRDRMDNVAPFSVRSEIGFRQGVAKPYNSERIPKDMRIADIWKALAKDPPVKPHCMARAMQLLNLAAIRGDSSTGFSRACDTKFTLVRDGSLPEAGKSITSSYGIKALAMLFINAIDGSAEKLRGSEQYRDFRINFKRYFEKYDDSVKSPEDPRSLDQVSEKIMPFCEGHLEDKISLDATMTSQLRSKVFELQNRQAQHISNCMGILFQLFDEREIKAGRFALSDYVWQEGTDALANITVQTRDMLMAYYADCEKTYKDGLFILYNTYKDQTADSKKADFSRVPFNKLAQ